MDTVLNQPSIKTAGPGNPVLQTPRGFRVAALDYGNAPQVNPRGFITGWKQVGEHLQDLGGALGQIGARYTQAKNSQDIADADVMRDQAGYDFAAKMASKEYVNNTESWGPAAEEHVNQTRKMLLSKKGLTPFARNQIELGWLKWSTQLKGQTKMAAISRQFDVTGQSFALAHEKALDANDFVGAAQIREQGAPYWSPKSLYENERASWTKQQGIIKDANNTLLALHGTEALPDVEKNIRVARDAATGKPLFTDQEKDSMLGGLPRQAKVDSLTLKISTDPKAAREEAQKAMDEKSIPGIQAQAIVNHANQAIDIGQAKEISQFTKQIAAGPASYDRKAMIEQVRQSKFLGPEHENMISQLMDSKPKNSDAEYEQAYPLVKNYDPATDPTGLRKAKLGAMLLSRFSGTHHDELASILEKSSTPKDPAKIDDGPALALLNSWVEGGGLGSYKTPVLDAAGKPTFKEKKGEYSYDPDKGLSWFGLAKEGGYTQGENTYEPQFIEDPAKKAGAAAKQAEIRRKLQDEMKIPGKFKSTDEVNARAMQLFQEAGGVAPAPVNPLLPAIDWKGTAIVPNAAEEGVQKALKILNK